MLHSYKDLVVWQRAMQLVVEVYELTGYFPKEENYILTSQMRRAAISIPSNIAEGRYRGTRKEFLQFIRIAYASGAELETQIELAKRIINNSSLDYNKADHLLEEVMKMLNVIIKRLNPNKLES